MATGHLRHGAHLLTHAHIHAQQTAPLCHGAGARPRLERWLRHQLPASGLPLGRRGAKARRLGSQRKQRRRGAGHRPDVGPASARDEQGSQAAVAEGAGGACVDPRGPSAARGLRCEVSQHLRVRSHSSAESSCRLLWCSATQWPELIHNMARDDLVMAPELVMAPHAHPRNVREPRHLQLVAPYFHPKLTS